MRVRNPTRFFSAQSAERSGIRFRWESGQKAGCWRCARESRRSLAIASRFRERSRIDGSKRAQRALECFARYIATSEVLSNASTSAQEVERIAKFAYVRAENRSRRVCSVDKANVLASSQLWRKTVIALSSAYPSVKLEHMYVDNAAMQLTLKPSQFDVMLTSNMFGDILSDAAAALVGSIGLIPSASFGSGAPLFEPIHGSAPSLAGTDSANPIGSILSATMMLRDAFGLSLEADWIEQSVVRVLQDGNRTPDLAMPGAKPIGTTGFMDILHVEMQRTLEHAERYGWGV